MFICKRKCDLIGLLALLLFIIFSILISFYINCLVNSENCQVLFIFSFIFFSLFVIYLGVWLQNSKKSNKIYPVIERKKNFVLDTEKNTKNYKYKIFKLNKNEIVFDQITI